MSDFYISKTGYTAKYNSGGNSNFLYYNNDYILNRSLGEQKDNNNFRNGLMELQECDEEKNILYEENKKKN